MSTANQMKFKLQLKFDSLFEFSAPAYDDRQISVLLTNAQRRIFIRDYNPLGDKYRQGFEGSEKRRRDLEQFIKSATLTVADKSSTQTGVHPNGEFYDLPNDFLYAIEEGCTLSGNSFESWVKPVKHDEYQANKNNPYKKPYSNLVWRMDFSREDSGSDGGDALTGRTAKRTELITDGTAITNYRVRYLATLPDIVCDENDPDNQRHCILDESVHDEIIDEAVAIAQAATQKDAYQVGLNEQKRSE